MSPILFALFAETTTTTTITPSGNFSDPNSWTGFIEKTGIPAFYGTLIILGVAFFAWKFGWFFATAIFGEQGWIAKFKERLDVFLERLEKAIETISQTQANQTNFCQQQHKPGGSANIEDIRSIAYDFADIAKKIGDGVGADVTKNVENIHENLRRNGG